MTSGRSSERVRLVPYRTLTQVMLPAPSRSAKSSQFVFGAGAEATLISNPRVRDDPAKGGSASVITGAGGAGGGGGGGGGGVDEAHPVSKMIANSIERFIVRPFTPCLNASRSTDKLKERGWNSKTLPTLPFFLRFPSNRARFVRGRFGPFLSVC